MHRPLLKFIFYFALSIVLLLATTLDFPYKLQNSPSATAQQTYLNTQSFLTASAINKKTINELPKSAYVFYKKGNGVWSTGKGPDRPAKVGEKIINRKGLRIAGDKSSTANLGFYDQADQAISGYRAVAGASRFRAQYYYPCAGKGPFAIEWRSGRAGKGCPEVSVGKLALIGPAAKSKGIKPSSEALMNDTPSSLEGASVAQGQFCSVVAPSNGRIWKVQTASATEAVDVCQKPLDDCQKEAGEACLITNLGGWRKYDPTTIRLNLLLQCADRKPYYKPIIGRSIYERDVYKFEKELGKQAEDEKAEFCVFSIYSYDQVLVSPNSDQRTIVLTEPTEDGYLVHDLVGTVTIRGSENLLSEKPIELKPGESYRFIEKTGQVKIECLSEGERKVILDSAIVKELLNSDHWSEEIQPQIVASQKALTKQFYQPPAIAVEPLKGGIKGWKATIDLTKPNVLLSINPSVGNLGSSAQQKKRAVVMGGLYQNKDRTQLASGFRLISQRKYISPGEQWGKRYTVLGLDQKNQPEIATQTDGADARWDQYHFAIQAGPRLVRSGKAAISNESAAKEGFKNLVANNFVLSRTSRSSLGYSADKTKLYYVVADNLSLPEFAKVLASDEIGAYEAMALDGGNGPALAYNGVVKKPTEANQPYFIIANQTGASGTTSGLGCQ